MTPNEKTLANALLAANSWLRAVEGVPLTYFIDLPEERDLVNKGLALAEQLTGGS